MKKDITSQEAIMVLNMIETHGPLPTLAKEKSIKALEKQIPKDYMQEFTNTGFFKRNICPECEDVRGLLKSYDYCPWCGQALKWD